MDKSQPTKQDKKSPTTPTDYVLEWMKENRVPLTKENYLHINYMGQEIPDGAEEEVPDELKFKPDQEA